MLALRYVYLLGLVAWLGGIAVLGALVAPATFQTLQALDPASGRELAGALFGTIIARFHYVQYGAGILMVVTLAAMALLGPRPPQFAVRTAILMLMLAVAAYSGFVVLADIEALRQEAGGLVSRLPDADTRRLQFDALHQLATRLMVVNMAGALVLLYWEARER